MASAQLRDTRRRIRSVEATKKITRAMELIAASRIPKAQARVHASKPYTAKLIEVIENVGAADAGGSHKLLERRDPNRVGLLIVSSDRGLAGAYSSSIIRLSEARAIELEGTFELDVRSYVLRRDGVASARTVRVVTAQHLEFAGQVAHVAHHGVAAPIQRKRLAGTLARCVRRSDALVPARAVRVVTVHYL